MIKLVNSLAVWKTPDFQNIFKTEVMNLDRDHLPLQQGLSQTSYVSDSDIDIVILKTTETVGTITVKTGIFFQGIIAGSCCSDDPTPLCEENEYCEVQFEIERRTGEAKVSLLGSN